MPDLLFTTTVALAFDALLAEHESRDQTHAEARRSARQLCGQWLILRRHKCRLTSDMIVERTGIDPTQLVLIEQGLATVSSASNEAWYRFCLLLEGDTHDVEWVATVLSAALGRSEATPEVLERMRAEFEAELETLHNELPRDQKPKPEMLPQAQIELLTAVFAALQGQARNGRAVRSFVEKRPANPVKIGLMRTHALLDQMAKEGLVELIRATDAQESPKYQLTPRGDAIATQLINLEQAGQQLSTQVEQANFQTQRLREERRMVELRKKELLLNLRFLIRAIA